MARLSSQEKLGYYKTPVSIVKTLKNLITFEKNCRIFDPCCADGEALSLLAEGNEVQTLGVELEKGRFETAKERLDTVHWADALTEVKMSPGSVDLLYLNPPYDYDDGASFTMRKRFEFLFLKKYLPMLTKDGLLVLIVPVVIFRHYEIRVLLARLSDFEVYRFPDGEFEAFKQVVIFGRKKRVTKRTERENHEDTYRYVHMEASEISTIDEIEENSLLVKKNSRRYFLFDALHIDPTDLTPLTGDLRKTFLLSASITAIKDIHPLMPLRKGHMAMLIAAGYLNGEIKKGDKHLVVKGTTQRVSIPRDESTETHDVTITREKDVIIIKALDMNAGTIEEIR